MDLRLPFGLVALSLTLSIEAVFRNLVVTENSSSKTSTFNRPKAFQNGKKPLQLHERVCCRLTCLHVNFSQSRDQSTTEWDWGGGEDMKSPCTERGLWLVEKLATKKKLTEIQKINQEEEKMIAYLSHSGVFFLRKRKPNCRKGKNKTSQTRFMFITVNRNTKNELNCHGSYFGELFRTNCLVCLKRQYHSISSQAVYNFLWSKFLFVMSPRNSGTRYLRTTEQ